MPPTDANHSHHDHRADQETIVLEVRVPECGSCGYSGETSTAVSSDWTTECPSCEAQVDAEPREATVPDAVPTYVQEGVERQDVATLRELATWALQLATRREFEQQQPVAPEEIEVEADEELVDVEQTAKGTIVEKMIPCGKDCNGCPHGPYKYRVYRDGDDVKTEYLGKA